MNSDFQMFFCNQPPLPIHKIKLRLKIDFQTFNSMTHPNIDLGLFSKNRYQKILVAKNFIKKDLDISIFLS